MTGSMTSQFFLFRTFLTYAVYLYLMLFNDKALLLHRGFYFVDRAGREIKYFLAVVANDKMPMLIAAFFN